MERGVFEELKKSLEQAAEDWKNNNPAKKQEFEKVSFEGCSYKDLPLEEYRLFMDKVGEVWDSEIHKEGYIRNYQQVIGDCWKEWDK